MWAVRRALQRTTATAAAAANAALRGPAFQAPKPTFSLNHARFMANTKDDGQFKTWKPLAPTLRQRRMVSRQHLHKGGPVRELTIAKRRTGGRNNTGRITCRHRGGGAKRRIRLVDFRRSEPGPQKVIRLEYDPGRSAHIALIEHMETKKLSYILAPAGLRPGSVVQSYMKVSPEELETPGQNKDQVASGTASASEGASQEGETKEGETAEIKESVIEEVDEEMVAKSMRDEIDPEFSSRISYDVGNCMPLKMIPLGCIVHNIGLHPFGRAQLVRSAGTSAQVLNTGPTGCAHVKLSSGEVRKIPVDACATIGSVSNPNHKNQKLGGAGARRRRGWRPTVRGTAMNTNDHPHGGGRGKSKNNKDPRSPWGKLAKGGKTRKHTSPMVIRGRPRR